MILARRPACLAGLALMGLAFSTLLEAQLPADPFASDGWYRWEVRAVSEAQDWCCYSSYGHGHNGRKTACHLDGSNSTYLQPDQADSSEGTIQIFARVSDNHISRIRVISSGCTVGSHSPWTDLGPIPSEKSLHWLTAGAREKGSIPDGWMTAVAVTEGSESRQLLETIALESEQYQQREHAIFWMGQLRFEETRETLLEIIDTDPDKAIREQAIFSLSQSTAGDRLDLLIGLVEDSDRPMTDRKRALFWLAQTDDGEGVDYIQSLLLRP